MMSKHPQMVAFAANRVGRTVVPPVAGLVACAILCVVAGGCGGDKMTPIGNAAEFQEVLKADRPVLVDFYKGGCPTCILLGPTMDKLVEEYKGRVIVAK